MLQAVRATGSLRFLRALISSMAEAFTFPGKDLPPGPVDWVDAEHLPRQAVDTKGLFFGMAAELVQLSVELLCCEGGL